MVKRLLEQIDEANLQTLIDQAKGCRLKYKQAVPGRPPETYLYQQTFDEARAATPTYGNKPS